MLIEACGDHRRFEYGTDDFNGHELTAPARHLRKLPAYQEFWHSWRTFHPERKEDQ